MRAGGRRGRLHVPPFLLPWLRRVHCADCPPPPLFVRCVLVLVSLMLTTFVSSFRGADVEQASTRLMWCTFVEAAVLIWVSWSQLSYIRRFFETKRVL